MKPRTHFLLYGEITRTIAISIYRVLPYIAITLPLANLGIIHEGCYNTTSAALASLTVHYHHMLGVRIQPGFHGTAYSRQSLQRWCQVVRPPEIQHLDVREYKFSEEEIVYIE